MMLSSRNKIYLAFSILSCIVLATTIIPVISRISGEGTFLYPTDLRFLKLGNSFLLKPSMQAVFMAIFSLLLYSPVVTIYIYKNFEKTPSPEIAYFAFFLACCSCEGARIFIYFLRLWDNYSGFFFFMTRMLIFAHFFSFFCFLFIGTFSYSDRTQETNFIITLTVAVSVFISRIIPVNSALMYASLTPSYGFSSFIVALRLLCIIAAALMLLQSGKRNNVQHYRRLTADFFMLIAGYGLLIIADCLLMSFLGITLLIIGTFRYLQKLRRHYLWN